MKKKKSTGTLFTIPFILSAIILIIFILMNIFAPLISPYSPEAINAADVRQAPSLVHLLGTDNVGHDAFSRLLYGGRKTVTNALIAVVISAILGIPTGMLCGYYGGKLDNVIMRILDVLLAFPSLLLALLFVAVFGSGSSSAVIALGIVYMPLLARLARSCVMTEKTKVYVEAARSLGYSDTRIIFSQILPNCISTYLAELTLDIGYAILDLAALSFMGLGVQPPQSDWGTMLKDGFPFITTLPWLSFAPSIAIVLIVVALNTISDQIQMYLDVDQRKLPSFRRYRKQMEKMNRKKTVKDMEVTAHGE
ncbi:MAG: ABC transporter permease [Wujia sp.]